MTAIARIAAELAALETIQADLAAVTTRTDPGRRLDLVRLRRRLSDQIATIGQAAEPAFTGNAELQSQFRQHYSAMRSATALHQAEWPAVRLDEADGHYQRSVLAVREKNRAFVTWLRAALDTLERGA